MKREITDLQGRNVLVVGLGKTGEAVADFLLTRGARVWVSEKKPPSELAVNLAKWKEKGVTLETGGHRLETFLKADLIVPSPGVPLIPEIKAAQENGIKVLAEIELAASFLKGKIIGITGTNGKSTTASLTHQLLRAGHYRSHLVGNIGQPLIRMAASSQPGDTYVTEISSFQLEFCHDFRCDVAVFLNFSPNHLDWHGSVEAYWKNKQKLFTNLKASDTAILNRDDLRIWGLRKMVNARVYDFSQQRRVVPGAYLENNRIIVSAGPDELAVPLSWIKLPGTHNLENVMAALIVSRLFAVPREKIKGVLNHFTGLEHRLEKVLTLRGVTFYNDSKATTVDSTLKALSSLKPGIILIMGGRDKGADFDLLRPLIERRVRTLILFGEAREKIKKALGNSVPVQMASTMKEAVSLAFQSARPNETVLLSPACSSFDMFLNFEHRGKVFKREVRRLARQVEKGQFR